MSATLSLARHFADPADPLGRAFVRRNNHPWLHRSRPLADPGAAYARLLQVPRIGKRVAYIHVPFCANHCLFCAFYRNRATEDALHLYAERVIEDIAATANVGGGPVHAVYFGGGTPSALSANDLSRLIGAVRRHLPLAPDCEITVEGRVTAFDSDKIDACLDAGANRFSIGVQTFDTALRQRLGRKADREGVIAFMTALRDRDRAAVVCDLIFGLPGQDMEMWRRDVQTCIDLGLDGVDLYCLTLHAGSPLALSIDKGALPPLPSPEETARMYAAGLEIVEDAGWRHLNQAHWAANTRERNLYNQLVKAGADCLGFGSGAGGLLDGHRYMVDADCDAYQRRIGNGEKPVAAVLPPSPYQRARDMVMEGLELGRLDLGRLNALTAPGFSDALAPLFDQWTEAGLMRRRANALVLTTAGWFWHCNLADSLFELMGDYLGDSAAANNDKHGGHHVQ